jgi:hypothetical protein
MKKLLAVAALAVGMVGTAEVSAATYDCRVTSKTKFTGVTPDRIRFRTSGDRVTVSDNVGKRIGKSSVTGKLGRKVGNVQLVSWKLSPIPQSMKPQWETKFYEATVNYRARINTRSGQFSMSGSFVTRVSSANDGLNMQGFGRCRRL